MKKEWKIEVKLTVEDIFFFLLRHSFSSWQGKLTWALGVLALIGSPLVAVIWKDAFTAIIFLIVAIMYLGVSPLSLYSNAKRQMISNSVFRNKIVFTIDEEMLQIKQYTGEAKLFWEQLERIDLAGRFYLLYVNRKQAFILPKRFVPEGEIESLESLLREKQQAMQSKHEDGGQAGKDIAEKEMEQAESFSGSQVQDESEQKNQTKLLAKKIQQEKELAEKRLLQKQEVKSESKTEDKNESKNKGEQKKKNANHRNKNK